MTGDGAEVDFDVMAAVARFDVPRLGLLASREELVAWAATGLVGVRGEPPIGPEAAIRAHLPTKHVPLAKSLAMRAACGRGLRCGRADVDDLVAAGVLGLLMAAMRFDPGRGLKFATYATWHVRNEIAKAIRAGGLDRRGEVWHEFVGVDLRTGRGAEEGDGPEEDRPEVDPKIVGVLLGAIPSERDRRIVMERFGAGVGGTEVTFEGIGIKHGVSKERVRQIMKECMRRMRDTAKTRGITIERCFLGHDANVA